MEFGGKIFALFCLISIAASAAVNNPKAGGVDGTSTCPGGYAQGETATIGRYWYECRDGKMEPKGCLDESDQRVDVGATFDTKSQQHRMQCVKGSDGFLTVIYKACLYNGQERDVGAHWDDGAAFYICRKDGPNSMRTTMLGCVDQGRQVQFDDKVAKGDFLYQCKKTSDGTPNLNKAGCVKNGRKLTIGETFEDQKFWYTCTTNGVKTVGCMHDGQRMKEGDRYTVDDIEYKCSVQGEMGDQTEFTPFSCLQRDAGGKTIERHVGCYWQEDQFEYTCKGSADGKITTKVQVRCIYKAPLGTLYVDPGCARTIGGTAVGCQRDSSGRLSVVTDSADNVNNMSGLKQC